MGRYDCVLFDADNTLFDFDRAEREALRRVLEERDYPLTPEIEGCYQAINTALWDKLNRGEIDQETLLVERFSAFMEAVGGAHDPVAFNRDYLGYLAQGAYLLPGALDLCQSLAPHIVLAIATNGVAFVQRARLDTSPLAPLVPWIFISEEIGYSKPQAGFFDVVFGALEGIDRRRTVMVGDNLISDIAGGRAAGMDTIWYNPKHLPCAPEDVPTWTVFALETVAELILT